MNPNITEGLTEEQLQSFDIDSIEKIIKNFEETKELNSFDLDSDEGLTLEEIEIYNKLKGTSDIIENLHLLLQKVKSTNKKEKSWTEELFGNNETISSKNIEEYNKDEAIKVLNYLNNNYDNYDNAFSKTAEELTEVLSSTDSLEDIDTKAEVNIFQKKLIEKIMGTNEGFSSEYLQGYNNKKGNFIVDTGNFMANIKKMNISDINSHVLTNFFKLLTNGYRINILELKALFGEKQLAKLKEYWNSDKSNNIAKNYLLENGLGYIIEMMDTDFDYYASLSKKELKEKLSIVKDNKEKAKINFHIYSIKLEEKLKILEGLNYDKKELKKLKEKYDTKKTSNDIFDRLNNLVEYNSTLSLRILDKIEKNEKINGNTLLENLGVEIGFSDNENEDYYYNIDFQGLMNILINEKNINKVLLIIKELKESGGVLNDNTNLNEISLIDEYLNKISSDPKNNSKQISNIIEALPLFRSQGLCPKAETVINLKKATIQNEALQNRIRKNIDNLYPNGENMGEKLIKKINEKLENSKKGKGYCTIAIVAIIEEFDKENAKYRVNPDNKLSNNQIRDIISKIMNVESAKSNNIASAILTKAGLLEGSGQLGNSIPQLPEGIANAGIEAGATYTSLTILESLSINQINSLTNISEEEKNILIKEKQKIKERKKVKSKINSYTDEELNLVRQKLEEGKDPFEIQKEIEQNREIKLKENSNEKNIGITFSTNENNYTQTSNGYILETNGVKIEGISEEEKKLTLGNPEATENLIKFYDFFKELNLESIWKYRKELMISIGNRNINFLDNDSLSKGELIQFGNNLIHALNNLSTNKEDLKNKPKLFITNSLSGVQNELRKFSGASSVMSDEKTHNIKGEDKFAATLRNFGIIGGAYFKINTFREQIKK